MLTELDESAVRARAVAREGLVGKTIAGRYIIRGLLGHGGMGAVYEAEHLGIGKRAAIKFVDPEFATDEKVVARFAREARAMSAIESAHIVTVFDAGSEDGRPYLVMELLRGEDLGQRLRRLRRIPLGEAMHVVAQVLKGLARAHAAGIVHRDLKPDNVFLVKHDTDPLFAKIVDFGISKIERPRANTSPLALTGRGTVLGTPFYMSPEQAQASSDVDGRTDLYSVGAILFECLTGRPPHTGESYEQVILSICMRDAPKLESIEPSISPAVSAFVARALARDKAQRFTSAERMLAALHEVAPEERARVPLDPPSAQTMLSEALDVKPAGETVLDGGAGAVRSSRPSFDEMGAATRLGMAALDRDGVAKGDADAEADAKAKGDADADAKAKAKAKADAKADERAKAKADWNAKPDANGKANVDPRNQRVVVRPGKPEKAEKKALEARRSAATSVPAKKPVGTALFTAALATLMGVGVTFGIISMLDKKRPPGGQDGVTPGSSGSASSASVSSAASPGADATRATSAGLPSPLPSASASAVGPSSSAPSGVSPSTAFAKPATPSSARAPATGSAPAPAGPATRPTTTKPLDIQRDLP